MQQTHQTITAMVEAQHTGAAEHAITEAHQRLAEADRELARHRAALEAGADPAGGAEWITQTQAERADAEAALQQAASHARSHITSDEIHELIAGLGDLTRALNDADPADKAEVYRQLGLQLTYHPNEQKVRAEITLDSHSRWVKGRVRGGYRPLRPPAVLRVSVDS